jgi:hypothetical protein
MKQTIGKTVDKWIEEESHQRRLAHKIIRKNDPWYGMSEEEIEDRREFIRCYLLKDFETILMIPFPSWENDFWFNNHQEFIESAFNTWDFQRMQRPFDKYGYRVRKVMEQMKDLALLHSCISQPEGRKNIHARIEALVNNEFRDHLLSMVDRYKRTFDEERRFDLRRKIARLSGHILECKRIWEKYSPWEDSTSHHVQINSVDDG